MSPKPKLWISVSLTLLALSCSPKHQASQQHDVAPVAVADISATENVSAFRSACSAEIQTYCANDPHKRRCLRDNMEKLSDGCKAAVNALRNDTAEHRQNIRLVCENEMQKLCANDPRKLRCLKNNLDQLGAACKAAVSPPRDQQQSGGQQTNENFTAPGNVPAIGTVCSNEIQTYCATDPRRRRCLHDHMEKLNDACKAAVNAPRNSAGGAGEPPLQTLAQSSNKNTVDSAPTGKPSATPAVRAARQSMLNICAAELNTYCSGSQSAGESKVKCLKSHSAQLSPNCATALQNLRAAREASPTANP